MTDEEFRAAVEAAVKAYEIAITHGATRTRRMISDYGEVEALSRLMLNPSLQVGFRVLRDSDQLGKTFESVVVQNKDRFAPEVVASAQWRLDNADRLPE